MVESSKRLNKNIFSLHWIRESDQMFKIEWQWITNDLGAFFSLSLAFLPCCFSVMLNLSQNSMCFNFDTHLHTRESSSLPQLGFSSPPPPILLLVCFQWHLLRYSNSGIHIGDYYQSVSLAEGWYLCEQIRKHLCVPAFCEPVCYTGWFEVSGKWS